MLSVSFCCDCVVQLYLPNARARGNRLPPSRAHFGRLACACVCFVLEVMLLFELFVAREPASPYDLVHQAARPLALSRVRSVPVEVLAPRPSLPSRCGVLEKWRVSHVCAALPTR